MLPLDEDLEQNTPAHALYTLLGKVTSGGGVLALTKPSTWKQINTLVKSIKNADPDAPIDDLTGVLKDVFGQVKNDVAEVKSGKLPQHLRDQLGSASGIVQKFMQGEKKKKPVQKEHTIRITVKQLRSLINEAIDDAQSDASTSRC